MSRLRVALTFDTEHPDRPAPPGNSEAILAALERQAIPATFFIQGRWAEAYPETARSIARGGHLVGSHTHYHARMPLLTDDGIAEDLAAAAAAIEANTGVRPEPWFRLPFGAGAEDARVMGAVVSAGYRHVGWHVAADDWDPLRSEAVIADEITDVVLARGDDTVVLFHSWPAATPGALASVVSRLTGADMEFVRVDQLPDPPVGVPW